MIKEYRDLQIAGIQCIRISAISETDCADAAVLAAKKLMERNQILPEEIGTMIYVTQSPRFMTPSTSFYIHKELKMGMDCFQYDINQGASGCLIGIQLVSSLMSGFQQKKKGLLLLGDNHLLTEGEVSNEAAAVLIEPQPGECIYISNYSDGTAYKTYFQTMQQEKPEISEDFFENGAIRLREEMEKMERFTDAGHVQIDNRLEYSLEVDSAVRFPFYLSELKMEGNVLVGTVGAGMSVAAAVIRLKKDIYNIIVDEKEKRR